MSINKNNSSLISSHNLYIENKTNEENEIEMNKLVSLFILNRIFISFRKKTLNL